MRKIEEQMVAAVQTKMDWKSGNTAVIDNGTVLCVKLHGNLIARFHYSRGLDRWEWTLAGWNTPTTRSRINALARAFGGAGVTTKRGQAYADLGRDGYRDISSDEWVQA